MCYNEKGIVKVEKLVLVTPTTEHNCKITWCLNKFLLCHFNQSYDTVYLVNWHYFENHHGKGAVDGLGGCVKNTVYCHFKAGKTVLSNPKQFAEYANSIITYIDILYIRDDDLLYDINEENVKEVPGALKVRHVERKITGNIAELLFYILSNTSNTFLRKLTYSVGSIDNEASDVTEREGESTMHAISVRSLVLTMKPDFQLLLANGMLFSFMNGSTGLLEGCY